MSRVQRIRQKIIDRDYYISSHAEDEMLDDELAACGRNIHVVCRFKEVGNLVIITGYALTEGV